MGLALPGSIVQAEGSACLTGAPWLYQTVAPGVAIDALTDIPSRCMLVRGGPRSRGGAP
jgi:hypothetical protein